jgi:hypothetical protein
MHGKYLIDKLRCREYTCKGCFSLLLKASSYVIYAHTCTHANTQAHKQTRKHTRKHASTQSKHTSTQSKHTKQTSTRKHTPKYTRKHTSRRTDMRSAGKLRRYVKSLGLNSTVP